MITPLAPPVRADLAPPCGTASRARGKRLHFLRDHGIKEPRPLRDDVHPDGFAYLQGNGKLRTELANMAYENTVLIAKAAIKLHIAVTIENPANSLMWKTSPFVKLFADNPELVFFSLFTIVHMEVHVTNLAVLQQTCHGFNHLSFAVTDSIRMHHGHPPLLPEKFITLRILKLHIQKFYVNDCFNCFGQSFGAWCFGDGDP